MNRRLTAYDIVKAINLLPQDRAYHYVNPKTRGQIHIVRVDLPEGPVVIKRYNPAEGETLGAAKEESISTQMIWRVTNAFRSGQPTNFDRVLGGSYNTRSVLESLIAHTAEFYFCYPGRIEDLNGSARVKHGHKHLIWLPEQPHKPGVMEEAKTDIVISEVPNLDVFYDALVVPDEIAQPGIDIDVQRRHAQMQIALIYIGLELGFRTWIAQNDKGIIYKNKRLGELEGVIVNLGDEKLVAVVLADDLRNPLFVVLRVRRHRGRTQHRSYKRPYQNERISGQTASVPHKVCDCCAGRGQGKGGEGGE